MNRYPHFKNENLLQVISSRGCPLYCSFCINGKINEFYKNQSIKFHRQKSPQFLINELKNFLILFPKTKTIFFPDDIFLLNKKFIKEFAELYSKEIAIPFVMTTFPFYIDDEIAKLLKNANCKIVMTAPETANEQHRFEIFKKKIKNQHFIDMSKIAKKHNLKIYTTAMFVYPKQTIDDVYKTIEFNHQLQTDIPFKSFLQPYPHTEIYEIALKNNNIPQNFSFQDLPQSYFLKSPLNHQQKNEITLIYYFYYFLVKYPSFYKLIKKRLYILKLIPFKTLINYFGIFLWFKNFKNLSSAAALLYMLRFWKDK
ncbi:MAG TPA: radical SAM protein [bacterium]|nr:radical SAM protein [bacterium]